MAVTVVSPALAAKLFEPMKQARQLGVAVSAADFYDALQESEVIAGGHTHLDIRGAPPVVPAPISPMRETAAAAVRDFVGESAKIDCARRLGEEVSPETRHRVGGFAAEASRLERHRLSDHSRAPTSPAGSLSESSPAAQSRSHPGSPVPASSGASLRGTPGADTPSWTPRSLGGSPVLPRGGLTSPGLFSPSPLGMRAADHAGPPQSPSAKSGSPSAVSAGAYGGMPSRARSVAPLGAARPLEDLERCSPRPSASPSYPRRVVRPGGVGNTVPGARTATLHCDQ